MHDDSILVKHDANEKGHEDHKIAELVTSGVLASVGVFGIMTVSAMGGPIVAPTVAISSLLVGLASIIKGKMDPILPEHAMKTSDETSEVRGASGDGQVDQVGQEGNRMMQSETSQGIIAAHHHTA